ncbi:FHA domain-containing protein [Povalibacter sp.]|uniref:FHA domain-containing protein n=1 Tax=Povalibacter sp. TaxID=1962978 RepID=UPI002F41777E
MSDTQPFFIKIADGREIPLKPEMSIGRQAECDLQLIDGHPSRRHARVTVAEDGVWLEDLGSANGSFVNGARVNGRVRLASGDRLRFDVEEFDLRIPVAAVVDDGKTIFRADEAPALVAQSNLAERRPGAWADPDSLADAANKTKFIDPAQLKQMIDTAPKTAGSSAAFDGPHLQVVSGSRAGLTIRMTVGESGVREWNIGSQSDREVQFHDSGVSALHARIVNEGVRWKVLDQMSANGTFVNGKRSNVSYLTSGDRLRFGPVECIFHTADAAAPAGSASVSDDGARSKRIIGVAAFVVTLVVIIILVRFVL